MGSATLYNLPKNEFALKYERCMVDELRGFLEARTGHKSTSAWTHLDHVVHLRLMDECANFRFLDLPPELRNLVYNELVLLKGQNRQTC